MEWFLPGYQEDKNVFKFGKFSVVTAPAAIMLAGFMIAGSVIAVPGPGQAFVPSGFAIAYGHEAREGTKCLKIKGTRKTGVLTVTTVKVTDRFGNPKEAKYTLITGESSSSPRIQFDPPLKAGYEVIVELTTSEPKKTDSDEPTDHGILDTEWC